MFKTPEAVFKLSQPVDPTEFTQHQYTVDGPFPAITGPTVKYMILEKESNKCLYFICSVYEKTQRPLKFLLPPNKFKFGRASQLIAIHGPYMISEDLYK